MEYLKPSEKTFRLLQSIALASGIFAFVLCILISVNYFQLQRADPLNSPAMKVLVERMNSNSADEQVKQEIRELDLLSRKAFFANRWQIKTGGYLLIFNVLILVVCLKAVELLRVKLPEMPGTRLDNFWDNRKINRKWVAYAGGSLLVASLLFAYLTHRQLAPELQKLAFSAAQPGDPAKDVGSGIPAKLDSDTAVNGNTAVKAGDSIAGKAILPADGFPGQQEINSNFPGFRGPGGNGIAFQKNIPTSWDGKSGKNFRWKSAIPLPGYNSPVFWNEKVFLSGASENSREVYCFDAGSGKILWKSAVDKIPGSPAQSPKVNRETGLSAPTLTTDGRRVYAIFANGDLIALDMNGSKVWAKNIGLPKNHYGHSSSLIMYHDLLIVQFDQTGGASVMALKGKTGDLAWKTSRDVKVSWSSPILVNTGQRMELMLVAEPFVISYDPANGKERWRFDCISGEVGPSLAYAAGLVFSVNEYSKLAAIQCGDAPKQLWESNEYMSDIPSPVATGKYLFLPTSYGLMVCYDAKSGTKYWEKDFGTPTYASPMLADGKAYQLDKKGIMHIFRLDKTYVPVGEAALGESSVCTPAFADGRIFIRGDRNLYCIGK